MGSRAPIRYKASVERDLRKLDPPIARRILQKLEEDLGRNPNRGEMLSGDFQGLFKYRVGDYRVIYTRIPEGLLILRIGHRKESYR